MPPVITVVMPVHNASTHLVEAVDSVLSQTFRDFELLAIDDASTDDSPQKLSSFRDQRLRTIRNDSNLGVARTLNRGMDMACGEFVARMDADDISRPRRLEAQLAYMRLHPGTAVCGGQIRIFGNGRPTRLRKPMGPACVKASLCLDNPLVHPTVLMRRAVLEEHHLRYDPTFGRSEDYDLWSRLADFGQIDNIPDVLLDYRIHQSSVTALANVDMERQTLAILGRELGKMNLSPSSDQLRLHRRAGHGVRLGSREELDRAEAWFLTLAENNARAGRHPAGAMAAAIGFHWFTLCLNNANLGPWIWRKWNCSTCRRGYLPPPTQRLRLLFGIAFNFLKPHPSPS